MKRNLYLFLAWVLWIGAGVLIGLHWTKTLSIPWPIQFYVIASCVTFWAYYSDKKAARAKRWRVSESGLHFMELAGGWPGALIARQLFRHKTAKWSYKIVFWCIVLLHLGLLFIWFFVWDCGLSRCSPATTWQYLMHGIKLILGHAGFPI